MGLVLGILYTTPDFIHEENVKRKEKIWWNMKTMKKKKKYEGIMMKQSSKFFQVPESRRKLVIFLHITSYFPRIRIFHLFFIFVAYSSIFSPIPSYSPIFLYISHIVHRIFLIFLHIWDLEKFGASRERYADASGLNSWDSPEYLKGRRAFHQYAYILLNKV